MHVCALLFGLCGAVVFTALAILWFGAGLTGTLVCAVAGFATCYILYNLPDFLRSVRTTTPRVSSFSAIFAPAKRVVSGKRAAIGLGGLTGALTPGALGLWGMTCSYALAYHTGGIVLVMTATTLLTVMVVLIDPPGSNEASNSVSVWADQWVRLFALGDRILDRIRQVPCPGPKGFVALSLWSAVLYGIIFLISLGMLSAMALGLVLASFCLLLAASLAVSNVEGRLLAGVMTAVGVLAGGWAFALDVSLTSSLLLSAMAAFAIWVLHLCIVKTNWRAADCWRLVIRLIIPV